MTDELRSKILDQLNTLTSQSLRCLGFASKIMNNEFKDYDGISHPAHQSNSLFLIHS